MNGLFLKEYFPVKTVFFTEYLSEYPVDLIKYFGVYGVPLILYLPVKTVFFTEYLSTKSLSNNTSK